MIVLCDFPVHPRNIAVADSSSRCEKPAMKFFCRCNVQYWAMCETHKRLLPTKETAPNNSLQNIWTEISLEEFLVFQVLHS